MNKVIIFKQSVGCRPCQALSAVLEHDLETNADKTIDLVKMVVTDINGEVTGEDAMALAQQYGIMAVPVTILVDENGAVLEDVRGLPDIEKLKGMFAKRG